MFPHATTVGIWIHTGRKTITMIDPGNFYNFAWGANGKNPTPNGGGNNGGGNNGGGNNGGGNNGGGNNGGGCIIS